MGRICFGYAGKKLLFSLVTVFIVIVSCCASPFAFLLAQGSSGMPLDLCREGGRFGAEGTLTDLPGPFSSGEHAPDEFPAELATLTEPTVPVSLINLRTRNKAFFSNAERLFNVGAMFFLPRILGNPYFFITEDLFPSAFHAIRAIRKLE